ncbi:hypothetical protein DH2020_037623 [Rehmannia glutinosa]|uniref:Protein FAR1-RELATED SEQUENCE n=1 Tax=Rehmannia glutinosa TaxID=99300 RepID=A0ABR0V0U6_REHGL
MEQCHLSQEHDNATGFQDLEDEIGEEVDDTNRSDNDYVLPYDLIQEHNEVQPTNSIIDQLESRLAIGQVVTSVEDAYLLYCKYAHAKGFSVKKGDQRYFPGTSELQAKEFECSCEGGKDEKCSNERIPIYQKPTTRTKCKARLRVVRKKGGEWKVGTFLIDHNHEMVVADQTYLLRSSRSISYAQKSTLEAMLNVGISIANDVSYMENEAQGPQNLRFTRKDAYDHLSRLKKHTKVENGDASALLHYFISKSNKESHFFWNVQLDDDNRVMNFFFRDNRSLIDYEYFGDVLSIDTTYRTNRYNLICCPFVGLNHHRQNIMFGLAFMSDETESSFEWLFRTFLDSMNGKQPEIIFTDQCQAMMNAVDNDFIRTSSFMSMAYKSKCPFSLGQLECNWRANEKVEDTRCRHGKAPMIVKNNPLLSTISDTYTLTIFKLFEKEFINSLNTMLIEQPLDFGNPVFEFKVKSHGDYSRIRQVLFNKETHEVKCSCHKFETMEIEYLMGSRKRSKVTMYLEMVFVNQTMRSAYELTIRCKAHTEARDALTGILDGASEQIDALFENLGLGDQNACNDTIDENNDLIDEMLIRNSYVQSQEELQMLVLYAIGMIRVKKEKAKEKQKNQVRC